MHTRQGWAGGLIATLAIACGTGGDRLLVGNEASGEDGRGAQAGETGGTGGSLSGSRFQVGVTGLLGTLCPGQCTEIRAQASGGLAPYNYTWNHSLGDSMDTHQVCPTEATVYTVTASDASEKAGSAEFGPTPDVTASITIDVQSTCSEHDSGTPTAVGPVGTTRELCRQEWQSTGLMTNDGWHTNQSLHVDDRGHALAIAHYSGTVNLGAKSVSATGLVDGLIVETDANCEVVWVQSVGGPSASVALSAVTTDSARNRYVSGHFVGTADFGNGVTATSLGLSRHGFYAKYSGNGEAQWVVPFAPVPPLVPNTAVSGGALACTANGDVLVAGYADGPVDLGAGPLDTQQNENKFLARLSPDGSVLWQRRVDLDTGGYSSGPHLGVWAEDHVALYSGTTEANPDFGCGPITMATAQGGPYLVRFDGQGKCESALALPVAADTESSYEHETGGMALRSNGEIVIAMSAIVNETADSPPHRESPNLTLYSSDDQRNWSRRVGVRAARWLDHDAVAVDVHGNIMLAGRYEDTATVGSAQVVSQGQGDVVVSKWTALGQPIWAHGLGGPLDETSVSIAAAPSGDVVVTLTTVDPPTGVPLQSPPGRLTLVRLAP